MRPPTANQKRPTAPSDTASRSGGSGGGSGGGGGGGGGAVFDGPHELWTIAATVLHRVLHGGSLKSLLAPMRSERARPVNALVTETLKRREVLERAVAEFGPWPAAAKSAGKGGLREAHELRLLLAHEMLFGRGLRQSALLRPARDPAFSEALERIRGWEATTLKAARSSARGPTDAADLAALALDGDLPSLPRYARVNTLKASVDDVVAALSASGWRLTAAPVVASRSSSSSSGRVPVISVPAAAPVAPCFWLDPHVPSLLVLPPHAELHAHALVANGTIILQDKASCLAPAALAPRPGELILDCCAAPGNKTTQLAALAAPGGVVIACERDTRRAGVLRARAAHAAGGAIEVVQTDFLGIDPTQPPYRDVTAVQLDPTCSGSGMVERASFGLAADGHSAAEGGGRSERLHALAAMQLGLLRHALRFPRARVVVYSTCSIHPVENELVVEAALADAAVRAAGWRLAPALPAWPVRGLPLTRGAEHLVRAGPEVGTNGFFVSRFERDT